MRISALLTSLLANATVQTVLATIPAQIPEFEVLFVGTYAIAQVDSIDGPFGTRMHVTITGCAKFCQITALNMFTHYSVQRQYY